MESFWTNALAMNRVTVCHRWPETTLKAIDKKALGNLGETIITKWAHLSGFQILHQGLRHIGFELDIVTLRGKDVTVLEVKTRLNPKFEPDMNTTVSWLNHRKRTSIRRGIQYLCGRLYADYHTVHSISVDLIAVDIYAGKNEVKAYRWGNILHQ